ncbi:MAG TPA: hypothetical protein VFQ25_01060 [Ktedonobacterales bacterium]|nr:hypothetical protein [Ktedonobacterales bacterium]
MRFPRVRGANLERREFALPGDFEGELNLTLIAFRREQQDDIDTWAATARELPRRYPSLRSYELPVISRLLPFGRQWLDSAMRAGIPDRAAREATITLYIDKGAFRRALELPTEETIYALLVTRDGRVLWRAEGRWSEEKGQALERALERGMSW